MHFEIIESATQLREFCDAVAGEPYLALDTEFARETTYYPLIGLVQVAGRERIACIDPLAFDAVPLLSELLLNHEITKVIHSCEQDLEVLEIMLGTPPCPVFDTQVAQSLLSEDNQLSYAALAAQLCGVELPKSHTRTDWLRRPLKQGQLEYAADDVRYLLPIMEHLSEQLRSKQRDDWHRQECERICSRSRLGDPDFSACWLKVREKQNLRGVELAILQETAAWRERQAMAENRTRRKILPDAMLLEIASQKLANSSQVADVRGIRRYLSPEQIVALADHVQTAMATPRERWPTLKRPRMTPAQSSALKNIMETVRETAATLGIASGILCNRKDAEKLVLGSRDIAALGGWRQEVIGHQLLKSLSTAES